MPALSAYVAAAVTLGAVAIAAFGQPPQLWGVDHLARFPLFLRLAVLVVVAAALIPPVADTLCARGRRLFAALTNAWSHPAGVVATALFVALVCYLARSSTLLFGDGNYLINNYELALNQGISPGDYSRIVTRHDFIYPATDWLNYLVAYAAHAIGLRDNTAASAASGVAVLNVIWAAILAATMAAAAGRTRIGEGARTNPQDDALTPHAVVFALALTSGAAALLFGYVENYTPAFVLCAVYTLLAVRAARGRRTLLSATLVLLLAVCFHAESLVMAPSLLYLALRRLLGRKVALTMVILSCAGTVAGLSLWPATAQYVLPAFSTTDTVGALSVHHAVDMANEWLLLWPAALVLLAWWVAARRINDAPQSQLGDAGGFITSMALPAIVFLWWFNPEIGMARDWDLYVVCVLGAGVVPATFVLPALATGPPGRKLLERTAPATVLLCAALTVAWVATLSDNSRAVARYQSILRYDTTNPGYAYENLADHFGRTGETERQIDALKEAYLASPNPRYQHKLARILLSLSRRTEAAALLENVLAQQPDNVDARKLLLYTIDALGASGDIERIAREGVRVSPKVADFHFFLGKALLARGKREQGLAELQECHRLDPPQWMIEAMFQLINNSESAPEDG